MNQTAHGVEQMQPQAYLSERVESQLAYYEKAAGRFKKRYMWMQTVIIVLGVLVPVVINLPATIGGADLTVFFRITATVMSLTLAIVSGILNLHKFGDFWLEYRMTEELLKNEKFLYLTRSGKYADAGSAYSRFVVTIEAVLSAEHTKFRALVEDATQETAENVGGDAAAI